MENQVVNRRSMLNRSDGLVVNGKLVYLCLGRIPKKEHVSGWLRDALNS